MCITTIYETVRILHQEYLEAHKENNVDKEIQGDTVIEQVKSKLDIYLEESIHI